MKRFVWLFVWMILSVSTYAQFGYGTTGLLEMPTAQMQNDKTVMVGGGYLHTTMTPSHWTYNTWNYYVNVTLFPWLEVAYTCTLFNEWVTRGNSEVHMKNQDRNYSARLRLWKEGWWKPWTPQIVIGVNDIGTSAGNNGYTQNSDGNGYWHRFFFAVTKHVQFQKLGELGMHISYLYRDKKDNPLNGPAFGANFRFGLPESSFWCKAINGINLMVEYDSKDFNIGGSYSIWKDRINAFFELSQCKHPSAGLCFKVCLK